MSESEHQHYIPVTFIQDNLVYKFIDSNLLAVTVGSQVTNSLEVYLIEGVTGKIVYKFTEQNVEVSESSDMLLSENFFILTFKRISKYSSLPQQVMTVTEFYENNAEKDTLKMLKDKFIHKTPRLNMDEFFSSDLETPFVAQESYVLTVDVKSIGLTQSLTHVTSKMLVLITSND